MSLERIAWTLNMATTVSNGHNNQWGSDLFSNHDLEKTKQTATTRKGVLWCSNQMTKVKERLQLQRHPLKPNSCHKSFTCPCASCLCSGTLTASFYRLPSFWKKTKLGDKSKKAAPIEGSRGQNDAARCGAAAGPTCILATTFSK